MGRCSVGPRITRQTLYFTAPYQVTVQEEVLPPPAADQVLVQMLVSAISPGTELLIYRGQAPTDLAVDETIPSLTGTLAFPLKYGYAAVGRVIAVGSAIAPAWLGRIVFSFHPHESHFLVSPDHLLPVPAQLSPEEAAFLPNMETAVNFMMDGHPLLGERVVVLGQGVVGLLTTALLARCPLDRLITLDRYTLRRERSLALGAHGSLDPTAPEVIPRVQAALGQDALSDGADLTYELSGNPEALDQAIAVTGFHGRLIIGSWYGQKLAHVQLGGRFHRSRMRLISSQVSTIAPEFTGRWSKSRRLQLAWQMLPQVRPSPLITHRIPFAQVAEAYALLDQYPEETIQVMLTYAD